MCLLNRSTFFISITNASCSSGSSGGSGGSSGYNGSCSGGGSDKGGVDGGCDDSGNRGGGITIIINRMNKEARKRVAEPSSVLVGKGEYTRM